MEGGVTEKTIIIVASLGTVVALENVTNQGKRTETDAVMGCVLTWDQGVQILGPGGEKMSRKHVKAAQRHSLEAPLL